MKKQLNPTIKAHLIRSAFYLLLLLGVCAIPFALAQRNATKRSGKQSAQFKKAPEQSQPLASAGGVLAPDLSSWTLAANYPLVIESPAVTSDGTYAYSAGGFAGGATNAVYRYDPAANAWVPLATMPTGAYDAGIAYAANTNKIYVFGGVDPGGNVLVTTQIYDIVSNTWTMGASLPDPAGRYFPSAVYYGANGKIYVMGGFDGATFSEQSQTWEYDPVANTWNTTRANIPVAMAGAGYSIVGQFIYLAGHWNGGLGSTDHYRYDIVNDAWVSVAPVPVAMYRPASGAVGMQTYLVGGGNPFFSGSNPEARKQASMRAPATSYTSTYIYDTTSDSWTTGPNTNVAHSFTGGAAIGARLLVVGGYNGTGDTNTVETATVPCVYALTATTPVPFVPGVTNIGNSCDDCSTVIALPFPVSLYGNTYTSAAAGSNGYLTFGTAIPQLWHHLLAEHPGYFRAGTLLGRPGHLLHWVRNLHDHHRHRSQPRLLCRVPDRGL